MSNWVKPYIKQNKGRMTLTIFLGLLGVSSGAMLLFYFRLFDLKICP